MIEIQNSDARLVESVEEGLDIASQASSQPYLRSVHWSARRQLAYYRQSLSFRLPLVLVDVGVVSCVMLMIASLLSVFSQIAVSESVWLLLGIQSVSIVSYLGALGLYRNIGMHPVEELERVVAATILAFLTLLLIVLWRGDQDVAFEAVCLLISGCSCTFLLPSIRHLARCHLGRTRWWRQPIVILSHSDRNEELVRELNKEGHLGWRPIGYVDDFQSRWNRDDFSKNSLGGEEDLAEVIERENVFWGMIESKSSADPKNSQRLLDHFHPDLPNIVTLTSGKGSASLFSYSVDCGSTSGVCYRSNLSLIAPRMLKRGVDIFVSALAILCLSPLFAVLMIAVRCSSRGPIFYSQERMGLNGNSFRIWKFRSMVQDADRVLKSFLANDPALRSEWKLTQKLVNDPRITSVGRFFRRSSLDELPQLWNVFNGSMSLVGPRPIIRSEIEKYGKSIWLYYRTKPGITGLWQVNGRNLTTYEERLTFDSFYVRNWSIWLDWYILLKTVRVVLLCEGAY